MKRAFAIIIPLILILAILGGIFYTVTYRSDDVAALLETYAEKQLVETNYEKAIQYYTYAARFSPRNPSIALSLSNAYALSGNYTKAEYTLVSMISKRPDDSGLYKALSRVYVQQGKLYDAEQMLNRISDEAVRAELDALRPATPVLSAESGSYNTHLELSLQYDDGNAFLASSGSYPCLDEPYEQAITLGDGTTEIYALVVSDAGLVSRAAYGVYTIGHVVTEAVFEDAGMDAWVRYILDLEKEQRITTDQLWDIQALYLPEDVASLVDLHYFENLAVLSLHDQRKIDCAPLTQLKKLQSLDLSGCHLDTADLTAISSLTSLKELNLSGCGVANVSSLQGLTQLKVLDLADNSIVTISALSRLTELTALHLSGNAITDISSLSSLTGLKELDLNNNLLKNTDALYTLHDLEKLSLSGCGVSDLRFIENMPGLTDLNLSGNALTDISILSGLNELKHLNVSNNQIADISFMADMLSLSTLNADHNLITELPYFHEDCVLQSISVNHNQITDAAGVCDLFRLNLLSMDYNELADISYLMYCTCLVEVNAFGNPLADVQELTETGIIVNYDPTYILDHPPAEPDEPTDEEETE
ncbi:MAG: tetratricopeptide repeat protein [Ruminococcaceae bacterium]|nr:tetratricopeptide repeat protein [Oscillospiraceae bacterium]